LSFAAVLETLFDDLEALRECGFGLFQSAEADEDVIGIEGRDGQNADAGGGQRVENGREDADGGEFELIFNAQGAPAGFGV